MAGLDPGRITRLILLPTGTESRMLRSSPPSETFFARAIAPSGRARAGERQGVAGRNAEVAPSLSLRAA